MTAPHPLPPALLSVRQLSIALPKGADRALALDDVSFELRAGEILCVVGESGSGKSLTANALLGLLPEGVAVRGGQALWQGREDLLQLNPAELRRLRGQGIGMIFQEPMTALNPLHTIGRQLAEVFEVHTTLRRHEIAVRVHDLLVAVQLPDPARALKAYPHELSGGQRQRVMIAMALALEPALLIADEPTTALDVTTQAQILHLIHELQRRRGTAVLFITHDFGVVAEIADRVAVMQKGKLVEQGPAEDVLNAPLHPYTRSLIAAVPALVPPPPRPAATTSDAALALEVSGLSKTYRPRGWFQRKTPARPAVNEVSLLLPAGATLGIVGESGSGKSTLARLILGLLQPDAGRIQVGGAPLPQGWRRRRERASQIQMVFQDPYGSLNPRHRVGDIVAQGPLEQGVPRRQVLAQVRELFALVGLDPNALQRYPHEFSGGQRQRIGLARALALQPRVLLADEPVSALDVSVQAQVLALLARLREQLGLSILFITHDLRVAAQICDRIAVMKDGRVVESGSSAEVFGAPVHPYTRQLLDSVPGRHWHHALAREDSHTHRRQA
ncbi:ABC transporter ATP-binding protein [Herbaspirillum huttiense F1]|uniref:ABC transporter ATP-binding protein n=1 Tax=Herbaspirillum huttiense subsp. lycopersici TaxID=3074428 RepID=A0ABU2EI28_9BURK|nr:MULTISPECIES: ABC transporter ATP-binding protein [Herbaspirillum]MDR6738672.1 peptide/nickel transport system ATP-binding protein [Herbaspirillum sp. 1173]MDR9847798.1 ABC transporter ATP-binding protein [Herbaspirillum huttiense SE1]MDT0355275.1 ABC transporter ATP-binding protein [Herbaspirillum huttiense F1]